MPSHRGFNAERRSSPGHIDFASNDNDDVTGKSPVHKRIKLEAQEAFADDTNHDDFSASQNPAASSPQKPGNQFKTESSPPVTLVEESGIQDDSQPTQDVSRTQNNGLRGDIHFITGPRQYRTIQGYVGRARRLLNFDCDKPGQRRRRSTDKEFELVDEKARELMEQEGYADYVGLIQSWRKRNEEGGFKRLGGEIPTQAVSVPKRKRISADKRVAAAWRGTTDGTTDSVADEPLVRRSKRAR